MTSSRLLDPAYLRDLFFASDPNLARLRTGLRAVLGAALSAWLLSAIGARLAIAPSAWLLGVNLAMSSAVVVPEGPRRQQRRVLVALPLVAAGAAALAALSSAAGPGASAVVSLALIFGAVWARRLGPVGVGGGIIAFMMFFVAQYLHLRPAQLPATAGSLLAGCAIAWAVRFWLVRDEPERAMPGALAALRRAVAVVLRRLQDDVFARGGRRFARRMSAHVDRLHEAALALDDLLVRMPAPTLPSGQSVSELRDRTFELQLAAERVVQSVAQVVASRALPLASRREVRAALGEALSVARGRPGNPGAADARMSRALATAELERAPARARDDVRRARTSLDDLVRASSWARTAVPDRTLAPTGSPPPPPPPAPTPLGLHPATRQAIQATLAGAAAMVVGQRLSATRWFWAVIASFVVFTRATTVADTVQRAWLRVLGTVLGAAAGVLLGAAVAGHPRLELVAVFSCIFLAYWLFRLNYAWLLFWFTALIAVLYRLLGQFSPGVMVLRVEETVVGAVVGGVIAAVVLPIRARTRVRAEVADVLNGAAEWIDAAVVSRASGMGQPPIDASRAMEGRLRALRATAQPLLGSIRAPRSARLVHGATAVVLYARHLAPGEALARFGSEGRGEIAEAGRRLAAVAQWVAAMLLNDPAVSRSEPPPPDEPIERARASLVADAAVRSGPTTPLVWLYWMERLDESLRDLVAFVQESRGSRAPPGDVADARAGVTSGLPQVR